MSALVDRIADMYAGTVDGPRLIAAMRESIVVVPTDGHDALLTITDRGLTWVTAFTDTTALARFARARGEGERAWPYLTTLGGRLLSFLDRTTGIAVDVGSEHPAFFPPVDQNP
jgi:hypothetical protein